MLKSLPLALMALAALLALGALGACSKNDQGPANDTEEPAAERTDETGGEAEPEATEPEAGEEEPAAEQSDAGATRAEPAAAAAAGSESAGSGEDLIVHMQTSKGPINVRLFADRVPLTSANFVNLIQRGYYDGLTFHRVIDNFMIQGGCPLGTGRGKPGYEFEDEFVPELKHDKPGILSMANGGPGTNGSQFFITHVPTPWLDGKHTVFGEVMGPSDQEVVNAIEIGDKIEAVTVEGDVSSLMEKMSDRVAQWNAILDEKFPRGQ